MFLVLLPKKCYLEKSENIYQLPAAWTPLILAYAPTTRSVSPLFVRIIHQTVGHRKAESLNFTELKNLV